MNSRWLNRNSTQTMTFPSEKATELFSERMRFPTRKMDPPERKDGGSFPEPLVGLKNTSV